MEQAVATPTPDEHPPPSPLTEPPHGPPKPPATRRSKIRSWTFLHHPCRVSGADPLAALIGDVRRVGVEGTGSYGAGITRHLVEAGIDVLEVDRPDRSDRRRKGKDDDLDAISAARAALHNRRTSTPKSKDGAVESLRVLRVTRATAIRARRNALQLLRMSIPGESPWGWHATSNATTGVRAGLGSDHCLGVCPGRGAEAEGFEPRVVAHRSLSSSSTYSSGRITAVV